MSKIINSSAFYLLFPLYCQLIILFLFFSLPVVFYPLVLGVFLISTALVFMLHFLIPIRLTLERGFALMLAEKKYSIIICLYICAVVLAGALDICVNGFKLLDPSSYAELSGGGRYVRHISILCWTLVPVGMIFFRRFSARFLIISYAIIFPILIIDRNRLLASFFALALCLIAMPSFAQQHTKIAAGFKLKKILSAAVVFLLTFSVLGFFRSGNDAFSIESSGDVLRAGYLPLREGFFMMPALLQQIILYVTTPVFNFLTVIYFDFRNEVFLISQLSPFGREAFEAYPYAPIMVPRFNVGSEFYPFVLYGGPPCAVGAFLGMAVSLLLSGWLFKQFSNIFTFLIFLKIAFAVFFMGFAPQFYLLLNLAFIALMLFMWMFAAAVKTACPAQK